MSSVSIVFDTLRYAKKLQKAGFTEEQAEVQAEALADLVNEQLATKADLKQLESTFRLEMKQLEERLTYKLTLRLGSLITIGVFVLAALIKL